MKSNPYNNEMLEYNGDEIGLKIYAPEGDVDTNEYPEL